jgi:hypothetical protein
MSEHSVRFKLPARKKGGQVQKLAGVAGMEPASQILSLAARLKRI